MKLDELLESESKVLPRTSLTREAARSALVEAAHNDIARRAKIVRLRRRRVMAACAAVVVVAGVATVHAYGSEKPTSHADAGAQGTKAPITTNFRTVSEVVDAAAAAPSIAGPGNAPYWKVVLSAPETDCNQNRCHRSTTRASYWIGLNKPGVQNFGLLGPGKPWISSTGILKVQIDGHWMTWGQANAKTWTTAQLKTIQFGGFNPIRGPWLSAPAWYRTGYDVASALISAPASHTIREQLWKILGNVPELQFQGRAKDSLGRPGWRLTLPSAGGDWAAMSYVVDAATGVVLEYAEHSPYSPAAAVTVVSAGPANSAPAPTVCLNRPQQGKSIAICEAPAHP